MAIVLEHIVAVAMQIMAIVTWNYCMFAPNLSPNPTTSAILALTLPPSLNTLCSPQQATIRCLPQHSAQPHHSTINTRIENWSLKVFFLRQKSGIEQYCVAVAVLMWLRCSYFAAFCVISIHAAIAVHCGCRQLRMQYCSHNKWCSPQFKTMHVIEFNCYALKLYTVNAY